MNHRSKAALAAGLAVLAAGASVASADAAYSFTSSPGGPALPAGTPFSMRSTSWALINPATGDTVSNCTNAVLSGTTGDAGAFRIEAGDMTNCKMAGSTLIWKPVFDAPWPSLITGGNGTTTTPYVGTFTHVKYKLAQCTYTGNLSPVKVVNGDANTVTRFVLQAAGTMTRTGCTTSLYPTTAQVTSTYTLETVGGAPATPSNDLVVAGP